MNQTIINVRYIQRLNPPRPGKPANPFSFGGGLVNGGISDEAMAQLSELAVFDYMGAAEYEFGRLPAAFSKMFANNSTDPLRLKKIKVLSKDVWVLMNSSLMKEAVDVVKRLGSTKKMEWKLKCPSLFPSILKDEIKAIPTQGWIDIENGYMFFVNEQMAQNFLKLLTS
jgi:hypothetical protein